MSNVCGHVTKVRGRRPGKPCQNPVAPNSTHCAAGHVVKRSAKAISAVTVSLGSDAALSATVDLDDVLVGSTDSQPASNLLRIAYPEVAQYWHPSNADSLDSVTYGSKKKVLWKCPNGHEDYSARVSTRVEAYRDGSTGCKQCKKEILAKRRVEEKLELGKSLANEYPALATAWSPENERSADEVTPGSNTKGIWICPRCGDSYTYNVSGRVQLFVNGDDITGCPSCASKHRSEARIERAFAEGNAMSKGEPELLALWSTFNDLSPDDVTRGSSEEVFWDCPQCGWVYKCPVSRRVKLFKEGSTGCPNCNSKGYDPNQPGRLYLLFNPGNGLLKVGKSNHVERRLAQHAQNGFDQVLDVSQEMDGFVASEYEQLILAAIRRRGAVFADKDEDYESFDGHTESWKRLSLNVTSLKELRAWMFEDEERETFGS